MPASVLWLRAEVTRGGGSLLHRRAARGHGGHHRLRSHGRESSHTHGERGCDVGDQGQRGELETQTSPQDLTSDLMTTATRASS